MRTKPEASAEGDEVANDVELADSPHDVQRSDVVEVETATAPSDDDDAPDRTDDDNGAAAGEPDDTADDDTADHDGEAPAPTPVTPADEPISTHTVRNCTNDHVEICDHDHRFVLSPLGLRDVAQHEIETFALRQLADAQVLRLTEHETKGGSVDSSGVLTLGFLGVIGYFVALGAIEPVPGKIIFGIAAPILLGILLLVVLAVLNKRLADVGEGASIVFVATIGAGLPIAALIFFGDFQALRTDAGNPELFGRTTQTIWIVIASLVPTLLYFIFDRQRALTIRRNFQQDIMRLDPGITTLYDVDAKFGDLLIEAVGADATPGARASRSNPYPIFIAAALIALGWLVVLPVVDDQRGVISNDELAEYFRPDGQAYVFGFLGTYFFSINLIARRYVRGDLRPKTYGTIAVRIITVFILSWVLEIAFDPDDWVLVAAFLIGILPETFFTLIAEGQRAVLGKISDAMREPHPLTRLEGIDLYDRSRLQDEGVNNVEALAHHDLIELMLATRIPVPRLVDWVDQAILYLHTVDERGQPIGRGTLRAYGIRTASDLVLVSKDSKLWAALLHGDETAKPQRLMLVNAAIADDEWMQHIRAWRRTPAPATTRFDVVDGVARRAPAT